jgi:hypothetical protein
MSDTKYFRGAGKLYMQRKVNGVYGPAMWAGNVSALGLSPSAEKVEKTENYSGQSAVESVFYRNKKVDFSATFDNFDKPMLAAAFQGAVTEKALGTVTGEVIPAAVSVAGAFIFLANPDVSTLVITDSSGAPATLVEGTDYEIESAAHGSIKLLSVGTYVLPLKAAYAYGATSTISIMSESAVDYKLTFHGLNSADSDAPVIVELEASMSPASQLQLIGDDFGSYEMAGSVLYKNGSFGVVKQLA